MSARNRLKKALPSPFLRALRLIKADAALRSAARYDLRRYMRYSSSVDYERDRQNLASKITESYHNLEKGLSLSAPRPGFGAAVVKRVIELSRLYTETFGQDEVTAAASSALRAYVEFNANAGLTAKDIPHLDEIERTLRDVASSPGGGGTRPASRDALHAAVEGVDEGFFLARSSVRQFDDRPVDAAIVESAVRIAQKSPAVCNRQFSRVYIISDRARVGDALRIQGGARGFAESVPSVAVITSTVRTFWAAGERTQAWTDGGMFAMSFLLGLHAHGLGAVPLNWSKTAATDREFHSSFDIPDDEVIVMLVAFGHVPSTYHVAASPRPPVHHALFER